MKHSHAHIRRARGLAVRHYLQGLYQCAPDSQRVAMLTDLFIDLQHAGVLVVELESALADSASQYQEQIRSKR